MMSDVEHVENMCFEYWKYASLAFLNEKDWGSLKATAITIFMFTFPVIISLNLCYSLFLNEYIHLFISQAKEQ